MSKGKAKRLVSVLISIFFAIILTFSLSLADTKTKHSKNIQAEAANSLTVKVSTPAKKIIRVAVLRDLPPLYVAKKDSKKPTGFAIELLEKISTIIGFEVELFVVESWEDAINALKAGEVHFIPGIAVIEKRKQQFIYSPEIVSVPVSFFRLAGAAGINSVSDLSGKKVAVIPKSAAQEALADYPDIVTIRMPNIETLLVSLLSAEVDAVLCPEYSMIKKASDIGVAKKIHILGKPFFYLKRAYQFRQEDQQLRNQVNDVLKIYLPTDDYLRLYQKWYEPEEFWTHLGKVVLITTIIGFIALLAAMFFSVKFLRTKKELVQQNIHFQTLFETMSLGVIYQAADGRIISANPAAEKILGISFEQIQGKTSSDPRWKMIREDGSEVPGDEHPAMIALRTGQKAGPAVRGVFHAGKNKHIWLSITAIPLFEQGKTEPFQTYAIFDDITEHKHMEKSLRENERLIKTVMDNLPVGVAVNSVDPTVVFTYMNDNFFKIYRSTREDLADPDAFWKVVYHDPVFREQIKKKVLDDCATGNPERMHWEGIPITREGQKTTYINAHNTPIPGSPLMISTVIDVTEIKRAEDEIRKLNEELEQRVANRTRELTAKTEELERINKVFIDRELRMKELKKRIEELEKKK